MTKILEQAHDDSRYETPIEWNPSDFTLDERRLLAGFFEAGAAEADRMLDGYLAVHEGMTLTEGWAPLEAERRIMRFSRLCYDVCRDVQIIMGCPATCGDRDGAAVHKAPRPFLVSEAGKRIVRARLDERRMKRHAEQIARELSDAQTELANLREDHTAKRHQIVDLQRDVAEKQREIDALRDEVRKSERARAITFNSRHGVMLNASTTRRAHVSFSVPELAPAQRMTLHESPDRLMAIKRLLVTPHVRTKLHLCSIVSGTDEILPREGLPAWLFSPLVSRETFDEILRAWLSDDEQPSDFDGLDRLEMWLIPPKGISITVENRGTKYLGSFDIVLLAEEAASTRVPKSGFNPLGI